MSVKIYSDESVLKSQIRDYGLNAALMHHVKIAKEAGDRMRINIQAEKTMVVIAEAQQAIAAIDSLYRILNDDTNTISEE